MQVKKVSVIIPTVNADQELDLAIESIKKNSDYDIEFLIVIDPDMATGKINQDILKVCKKHKIEPIINNSNLGPYGNWNKGAKNATTEWLIFATDDQYFAPHWDSNLLKYWKPKRLVSGRLVEPGIIPVYKTNIKKDFGVLPSEFKEKEFISWTKKVAKEEFENDGFFIPMLQNKKDYSDLGGYPTKGKFGTSTAVSNDVIYVQNALKKGYEFGTASDSFSYHFQASSWKKKKLNPTIAAVILTHNGEASLEKALKSIAWVDEIFIVDSGSTDETLHIVKKHTNKIFERELDDFSSQRNFGISKAADYDWVLMIDQDEYIEKSLESELKSFSLDIYLDGVSMPRKNYIFGKWIKHSDWYPDYRLMFFRPKIVEFQNKVHERAVFIKGNETVAKANSHIIHTNYTSIQEFLIKNIITYPKQHAIQLNEYGQKFNYSDLIQKPFSEFLRRFFLSEGYRDGVYGLVLALLMAMQSVAVYSYLWEMQGKPDDKKSFDISKLFQVSKNQLKELKFWLLTQRVDNSIGVKKFYNRSLRKIQKMVNNS